MREISITTEEGKMVTQVLDDCAALLEKYSEGFPRPDGAGGTAAELASRMLWLARDHGLRTIRGMNRLLRDDEGNAVLACTLLRAFYERVVNRIHG